uniref:Putative polyprotein n=1 Tax=Albugo laibachii Nc14 TaxID=890382 RepID=F0X080_9STRA|nr:putative polyprotein [Albugo laibachii Nc14]|eukprot:CCA27162.1 putative polyprotein [Albugo laibachii Nc14]
MCPFHDEFTEIRPLDKLVLISVANGVQVEAQGIGTIRVMLHNLKPIRIEDVLYVPQLDRRLLSITVLAGKGLEVTFSGSVFRIEDNEAVIVEVSKTGKLFILQCKRVEDANVVGHVERTRPVSFNIWHARLGHLQLGKLKSMEDCVDGLTLKQVEKSNDEDDICKGCAYVESSIKAFPRSHYGTLKAQSLLEMIHSDVMGPMHTSSQGGARYMVTFIDDYSRYVMVYFMKQKSIS